MFIYSLPMGTQPSVDLARDLLAQFAAVGETA